MKKFFYACDEILRMKWFTKQLVGFNVVRFFGHLLIHNSRHQYDRRVAQFGMLFYELAKLVTVFVRHDDVTDDGIRNCLGEQADCRGDIGAGDDIEIFAAKSDLHDLAHGGAVVYEINIRN